MKPAYHFSFEKDWRGAPLAFWVHVPMPGATQQWDPPAPKEIPHKGFAVLRVQFKGHELQFSAPAQLDHFIEVLSKKPLPTSRQLSASRGLPVGPNGHWLSRLPAALKSPRKRAKLVQLMEAVREVQWPNHPTAVLKSPRAVPVAAPKPAADSASAQPKRNSSKATLTSGGGVEATLTRRTRLVHD